MKKFRHFQEYLDSKGNLDKPKVDPSGDTGPEAAKNPPAAAKSGKGWDNKAALSDKPKPYAPPQTPAKQQKGEKGLANDGDKKLIYEPETPEEIGKEGGKKVAGGWTKTEQFLAKTKQMSLPEFTSFISDRAKVEGANIPPLVAFRYVNEILSKNPTLIETFIREIKRSGPFDVLVEQLMKHPETYTEMAVVLSDKESGLDNCGNLVRALEEERGGRPGNADFGVPTSGWKFEKKPPKGRLASTFPRSMDYDKYLMSIIKQDKEDRLKKESTDAPASDTEDEIKDKPIKKNPKSVGGDAAPPAKPRKAKSLSGEDLDMSNSDVVSTKAGFRPE